MPIQSGVEGPSPQGIPAKALDDKEKCSSDAEGNI